MVSKTVYVAEVKCHNCEFMQTHGGIPYGMSIEDSLYEEKCPNCGFYIIRRKRKR